MYMFKKTLLLIIVFGSSLVSEGIFAQTEVQSCNMSYDEIVMKVVGGLTDQANTYTDALVNNRPKDRNMRGMLLHFCDVMLGVSKDVTLWSASFCYGDTQYNPKQSLFMYSLCVNMDKAPWHSSYKDQFKATEDFDIEKFFKDDVTDLNDVWNIPSQESLDSNSSYHACNPKTSMGECNFTNFLPDIYQSIMNDLSNIKLASIYGYKYKAEDQNERSKAISDFAKTFFADQDRPELACNAKDIHYLRGTQMQDNQSIHCSHPKTYQYMDEMIKSAGKLVKKTELLDGKAIMELECKNPYKNPMSCAMATTGGRVLDNSWTHFQNVILNEQMYYNLFLAYYQGIMDLFINIKPLSYKNIGVATERDSYESLVIIQEQELAQQAMYQMLRQLKNLYATFPIHIGLLAYYEDILMLRNRFMTLYTPLHQLYYEFRNTQECSK
jgi:hypothetical protein